MSPARAQALGFGLLLALCARTGSAAVMEVVQLKDGSTYQGQLVEKVPGQRVVIQLATGEVKTFEWDQVAQATESPASDAPPAGDVPAPAPPPAGDVPAPAPPSPSSQAPADGGDSSHVITGWPDPHASAGATAPVSPPRGQQLDLGVVTSLPQFGSPRGIAGLLVGYSPVRWLGLEVTGGYDGSAEVAEGNLGWSLAETLRIGDTFGLGAGGSQHFGATGSGVANMAHGEIFFDWDWQGMVAAPLTMRMATGLATLFDGGNHPGACGFFNLEGGNTDDNGQPDDTQCLLIYFDVEFFYRLDLGRSGSSQ